MAVDRRSRCTAARAAPPASAADGGRDARRPRGEPARRARAPRRGGSALDAVEAAVVVLESHPALQRRPRRGAHRRGRGRARRGGHGRAEPRARRRRVRPRHREPDPRRAPRPRADARTSCSSAPAPRRFAAAHGVARVDPPRSSPRPAGRTSSARARRRAAPRARRRHGRRRRARRRRAPRGGDLDGRHDEPAPGPRRRQPARRRRHLGGRRDLRRLGDGRRRGVRARRVRRTRSTRACGSSARRSRTLAGRHFGVSASSAGAAAASPSTAAAASPCPSRAPRMPRGHDRRSDGVRAGRDRERPGGGLLSCAANVRH